MKCAPPMPESTYRKICQQECEWCAAGWEICCRSEMTGEFHQPPEGGLHRSCTAPTRDEIIDRLTSALERAYAAFDQLYGLHGHGSWDDQCHWWAGNDDLIELGRKSRLAALDSKEQVKTNAEV